MNNMYNTDVNNTVNIPKTERWFVVDANNQRKGPFSSEQIIQMYNNCVINDNTYVICQGMSQWILFKNSELAGITNNGIPEIPLSCAKNTWNWKGFITNCLVIALGIAIALIALMNIGSSKRNQSKISLPGNVYNYTPNSKENTYKDTEIINYEKVDIQNLFDELDNNAYRAEQTYQDKYIEFTGYIANFDSDGEYFSVTATKDTITFDTMHCSFTNDKQREIMLSKNKGDIVTVRGKIVLIGEILGYSVDIDEVE